MDFTCQLEVRLKVRNRYVYLLLHDLADRKLGCSVTAFHFMKRVGIWQIHWPSVATKILQHGSIAAWVMMAIKDAAIDSLVFRLNFGLNDFMVAVRCFRY